MDDYKIKIQREENHAFCKIKNKIADPNYLKKIFMEEPKNQIEQNEKKPRLPLGVRIVSNVAIGVFGFLSGIGIYWSINGKGNQFYTMTFILALILAVLMRIGFKFAIYALGALFMLMGYDTFHISDDNPGLKYIIGDVSIFIGCCLLLVGIIFRPRKEKTNEKSSNQT